MIVGVQDTSKIVTDHARIHPVDLARGIHKGTLEPRRTPAVPMRTQTIFRTIEHLQWIGNAVERGRITQMAELVRIGTFLKRKSLTAFKKGGGNTYEHSKRAGSGNGEYHQHASCKKIDYKTYDLPLEE